MEPVEINAGRYYLRAMRCDDRVDDRRAVLEGFTDPESRRWLAHIRVVDEAGAGAYIARRAAEWAADTRLSWAVADPLTGDMLGEVVLKELDLGRGTAEAGCWTHPAARGQGLATVALGAVLRFAFDGLGLREVAYRHETGNEASRRVAEKLGFALVGATGGEVELVLRNTAAGYGVG